MHLTFRKQRTINNPRSTHRQHIQSRQSHTVSRTKRAAQCKGSVVRGLDPFRGEGARGRSHFNTLCRQVGHDSVWARGESCLTLANSPQVSKRKVSWGAASRGGGGPTIPLPFRAALTIHVLPDFTWKKERVPSGLRMWGKDSMITICTRMRPPAPQMVVRAKAVRNQPPPKASIKHGTGEPPNHCDLALRHRPELTNVADFRTKMGLHTGQAQLGKGRKAT